MASVKFYLKEKNSEGKSLIQVYFRYFDKTVKFTSGELIPPSHWDSEKQRVKPEFKKRYQGLTEKLQDYKATLERIYRELEILKEPITPEKIRSKFDQAYDKEVKVKTNLFGFIDSYIKQMEGIKTKGTIVSYKQTLKVLRNFKEKTKKRLDFENINQDFYDDFTGYMFRECKLNNNTVGKHIKTLKLFMNESFEKELHNNLSHRSKRFKVLKETPDTIYLTEKEIQKIADLEGLSEGQERVRDLFVIGCYTGLRYGDLSKPEKLNINLKERMISLRMEKTSKPVTVPIHPIVKDLIEKYNGSLPEAISNQKSNDYLKDLGELAKITEQIIVTTKMGALAKTKTYSKCELISTHTARRSFATNYYLKGYPSIDLMKITGHKTETSFLKYIKVTNEQNAKRLLDFMEKESRLKIA